MDHPRGGADYPRSVGEFQAWFRTDGDCLDYLEWLRWPTGFACPACGHHGGWRLGDGRFRCPGCGGRASVTAGTIFDRTRTPLTVWFTACWLFATGKDGISANRARLSSPMAGRATADWRSSATSTTSAASGPPDLAERSPASCFQRCTRSHHSPSGGCSAPIRARPKTRTSPATSMSSSSASTAAAPAAGAWCSSVCLSSPSPTTQCATTTSSPTVARGQFPQHHRECLGIRRAWSAHQRIARGEQRATSSPVKWIPQKYGY